MPSGNLALNSTTVLVLRGGGGVRDSGCGVGDSSVEEDGGRGEEDWSPPTPSTEEEPFSLFFRKNLVPDSIDKYNLKSGLRLSTENKLRKVSSLST